MKNVIVVGCGRVGAKLANLLSNHGSNVCVIDIDSSAFNNLGRNFNGATIQGKGCDERVLLKAGIEDCDVLAAVTQYDNINVMALEVASELYGVPHGIARLHNPDHERVYMQLGIDYVCGTSLVAEEMFGKVISGHGSYVDMFGEFELIRFSLDLERVERKTIRVGELEREHDIRIVAFERSDGSVSSIPTSDSILYHGDSVLVCIRHDLVDGFSVYMRTK